MVRQFQALICAAFLTLSFSGTATADAPESITGATTVTTDQLVDLIFSADEVVLIDTRLADVFAEGHIEGAVNLLDTEMTEANLSDAVATSQTPVVFYCMGPACGRAAKAAEKAVEWGYSAVYYYHEGLPAWTEAGLPLAN